MPKLLVFCIDALCASDVAYMKTLPHFGKLLREGALVEQIDPVFPALTYTCHTSILTGVYAGRHGILHNEVLRRGGQSNAPWHCMKQDVKAPTLLDVAHAHGMTVCSLSWPVSGGADYDMNMPMIVPYHYDGYEPEQYLAGTATENLMQRYFYKHGRFLKGPDRSLDLYTMALALDILEDFEQPDIMLVKMCDLDSVRHTYGVFHQNTKVQLRRHDEELGALLECLRRKGTLEQTNVVVLGDHGQTDIRDVLLMNVLFKKHGLLQADSQGNITHFDAFCHSTGLAGLIEVRDPQDAALMQRVRALLESLKEDKEIQLSTVMDAEQAKEAFGAYGPFDFVIESALPISFGEDAAGELCWGSRMPGDHKIGAATHGGTPRREQVTTFFAWGPAVKPGVVPGHRSMVDEAPTMARMLGLQMEQIDGRPIEEILR